MHIELTYAPHMLLEDSEPLTVSQYWLKKGHALSPAQFNLLTPADTPYNPQRDICLLTGDAASGKTHAAVLLGIQLATERPMSTGLVTAPTQAVLTHNVVEKYRQLLPQLGLVAGQDYKLSQRQIRFANGSRIQFLSIKNPTIDLTECQWIHAEHMHHLTETQFNRLISQLRQPGVDGHINGVRFFGTGLPVAADSWQANLFGANNPYGFRQLTTQRQDNPALPDWYVQWLDTRPVAEPAGLTSPDCVSTFNQDFSEQRSRPLPKSGCPVAEPVCLTSPGCVSSDEQRSRPLLKSGEGLNRSKNSVLTAFHHVKNPLSSSEEREVLFAQQRITTPGEVSPG